MPATYASAAAVGGHHQAAKFITEVPMARKRRTMGEQLKHWGLLTDKQLEHATLNEHVSLRMNGEDSATSRYRVLRVATLTKVAKEK